MPAELFQGHVVTDGSLPGIAGKWRACGWSVVQLDFVMKNWGPCMVYGSMEAEFEVQRTIKRVASQESDCSHQGACRQQRNYRWAMVWRKELHRSKSWRCRFVDQDLGRVAGVFAQTGWPLSFV